MNDKQAEWKQFMDGIHGPFPNLEPDEDPLAGGRALVFAFVWGIGCIILFVTGCIWGFL